MVSLSLDDKLAEKLQRIADSEHRSVNEVLAQMIESYSTAPPSRPSDEDIEIPDWIRDEDKPRWREATRKLRPKLYKMARRYWEEVGNTERLALTDEELDKVFWLIDHEGIPRFKSEKDKVQLLPDSLFEAAKATYLEGRGSGRTDLSQRSRELFKEGLLRDWLNRTSDEQ